ncbi:hypothetical protein [Endozoicomonas sp. GU-1]|uniref:hypothetical protein n=2 Tax=Endozoicomonas TaxID=305899 RepID=UPI0022B50E73|nr:hypothetical protein [Endozoicomonas sp. GU-1]WBA81566.1 hypothetical protein O2T12_25400 [Endozoicomonas sp. GU-1]WBA84519.1 hypothetical protein O3276_14580 [Endozoicomonas sp. GU-1]
MNEDRMSQDSLSQDSMDEESLPLHWYEIPWPIRGHHPHFEMPHDLYDELVQTYPSINVEQELINAYAYMKDRFPGCSEGRFTRFITNWMEKNEQVKRKTNRWFGRRAADGGCV